MSAKIKLKREGAKKNPCYKIVVIDSRKPRDGRFIKILGYYQPTFEPYVFQIDKEESLKWIKQGVKMTKTVESLFKKNGVL
ncbi:MAG: 30S ribosomal protein S16 [Atribacterota bacterium]|nr:30S ribosomal protein S16 [Atribacterota bacterium]MDD5497142.1 30S ribosomal protein S16 [Atribacterota bacterium]